MHVTARAIANHIRIVRGNPVVEATIPTGMDLRGLPQMDGLASRRVRVLVSQAMVGKLGVSPAITRKRKMALPPDPAIVPRNALAGVIHAIPGVKALPIRDHNGQAAGDLGAKFLDMVKEEVGKLARS